MNVAHWVLTWCFNVTYGTKLRDPFTMYKVFRTECIAGVEFVADRFDFDWELVGKLVRLGYEPLEIPVVYNSRGFDGGKKVRFFRDPPTWIAACLRFRFCSLPDQGRAPAAERGAAEDAATWDNAARPLPGAPRRCDGRLTSSYGVRSAAARPSDLPASRDSPATAVEAPPDALAPARRVRSAAIALARPRRTVVSCLLVVVALSRQSSSWVTRSAEQARRMERMALHRFPAGPT